MNEVYEMKKKMNKSQRLQMVLVLGTFAAIGPLSIDMYLPSLPALTEDLKSSTSVAQLSLTACLLGVAIGQILLGPLSDQKGRRLPLILSLSMYSLSSILCASASSIWILILFRFIQGLFGAGGMVISRAIVRDLYTGPELTKFFSLLMLINGAAPILAPIIGGQLLHFTSWRGVFIVLSILGLFMVTEAYFFVKETLVAENRSKGGMRNTFRTFIELFKDRVFMGYALTQGFVLASMFAYISGSPFVVQTIFGASPQMFSFIFALNGFGIIVSSQVTGRLAGKIMERNLLKVGLGISLSGGLLLIGMLALGAGLSGILPALFLVVSSVGMVSTTCFSLAMQSQGKHAGSAAALLGLMPFILGSIMAPLVGIGNGQSAWPMGMIILSCEIIAVMAYLFLSRRKNK